MVSFDGSGKATLRFPLDLPAERWLMITAELQGEDAMPWDDRRSLLVELPPRRGVRVVEGDLPLPSSRFVRLALDPMQGRHAAWPIALVNEADRAEAEVVPLSRWPDEAEARRLVELAERGGVVVLALQPGLEASWAALAEGPKAALLRLLPAEPISLPIDGSYRAVAAQRDEPLVAGLLSEGGDPGIVVRRFVPFAYTQEQSVRPILNLSPMAPAAGVRQHGLLYGRTVGDGRVYTLATLPEARYTNMATQPLFLPLMVRMCLRSPGEGAAMNVEIGQPLHLPPRLAGDGGSVLLQDPGGAVHVVEASGQEPKEHTYGEASHAGLYTWRSADEQTVLAYTRVLLPAAESELSYRTADAVVTAGPNVIVARSMHDLEAQIAQLTAPAPRWSWAIALVLFLLCLEGLMGSMSRLWQPGSVRAFLPRLWSGPSSSTT
jgi:hypothetical protein